MELGTNEGEDGRRFYRRLKVFSGLSDEQLVAEVARHDRSGDHPTYAAERICIICAFRRPPMWQE